ncbi:MAG: ferredoxin, partial [Myxococcota bacterium]
MAQADSRLPDQAGRDADLQPRDSRGAVPADRLAGLAVKVRVDSERCVGHGRCYEIASQVFGDDERGHCVILTPEVVKQHHA